MATWHDKAPPQPHMPLLFIAAFTTRMDTGLPLMPALTLPHLKKQAAPRTLPGVRPPPSLPSFQADRHQRASKRPMHSALELHLQKDEQSPARVMLFISLEQEAHNSKPMCVVEGGQSHRGSQGN